MASAVVTFTAPGNAGARLRRLASIIEQAAAVLPDSNAGGPSVTLTINDTPASGNAVASVLLAGGGLPAQPTLLV